MGPMYHLVNEEHRNIALANCRRILKPGGFLFTIFLTPNHLVHYDSEKIAPDKDKITDHLHASITSANFQGFEVPQFRCLPEIAKKILIENGFETLKMQNLDGMGSHYPHGQEKSILPDNKKENHINTLHKSCGNTNLQGVFQQYVCVGKLMIPKYICLSPQLSQ